MLTQCMCKFLVRMLRMFEGTFSICLIFKLMLSIGKCLLSNAYALHEGKLLMRMLEAIESLALGHF
jgi:hypothetical protein